LDRTNRTPLIVRDGKPIVVTRGYVSDILAVGLRPQDCETLALLADYRRQTIPQIIADAVGPTDAEPPGKPLTRWELDRALEYAGIIVRTAHAILDRPVISIIKPRTKIGGVQ
jgi:hypothetical protein